MTARVAILSNGHGEDAVGALLAARLLELRPELTIVALPLVGAGNAYARLGLPVLGPRRELPSGGLLLHDWRLLKADLRAGFLPLTLAQLRQARRLESELLVVVGDLYALAVSGLARAGVRAQVQTLVSVHHARAGGLRQRRRFFMEHLSGLERALMRHLTRRVYARDADTAAYLRARGVRGARALGNPMLDGIKGATMAEHLTASLCVALLPGTRRYAQEALALMLAALARLPQATGLVAWAPEAPPAPVPGWALGLEHDPDRCGRYRRGGQEVFVYRNRFADVLHSAQLVLGTAGTANEQAAALGKPVVTFPLPPFYGEAFILNQQRLLSEALTVAPAQPEAIAGALERLWLEPQRYQRAAAAGRARMGPPGGARAIAADLLALLAGAA